MQKPGNTQRIIDYYSLLFTFPTRFNIILRIILISASLGAISFSLTGGVSSITRGLIFGVGALAASILFSDLINIRILQGDKLLTPRRLNIISYTWSLSLFAISLSSSIFGALTGNSLALVEGLYFSIALNIALRILVISVFSSNKFLKNMVAIIFQPLLILVLSIPFLGIEPTSLLRYLIGICIPGLGVCLMLLYIRQRGRKIWNRGLIKLFRAFVYAWAIDLNAFLEEEITLMGVARDLEVDTLIFEDEKACRAALVIPYIHPGPFRNVGSSGLTASLTQAFGKHFDCDALITHGISTHELDMTNSEELHKVINEVIRAKTAGKAGTCSPMISVNIHGARAFCQFFGDIALITLTLSPKSYDDLPLSLLQRIKKTAGGMGVSAIIIDAHNSTVLKNELTEEDVDNLFKAAEDAIKITMRAPQQTFTINLSRVIPVEWGIKEGMGPCGIASLLIKLNDGRSYGYILMDSNNMISGFNEKILENINDLLDDAVVLTSDTHMVNALGATTQGYSPFGEKMELEKILEYVRTALLKSIKGVKSCRARYTNSRILNVNVLGDQGLETLARTLEDGFKLFTRTAYKIIPLSLIISLATIFLG